MTRMIAVPTVSGTNGKARLTDAANDGHHGGRAGQHGVEAHDHHTDEPQDPRLAALPQVQARQAGHRQDPEPIATVCAATETAGRRLHQ